VKFLRVERTSGRVWGINAADQIFTKGPNDANFVSVPGALTHLDVDELGNVWGLNSNDDIFKREGLAGSWINVPGKLRKLRVRHGLVYGINASGQIYKLGWNNGWVNMPGLLNKLWGPDGSF